MAGAWNFLELRKGEVRRILLPRTPVNMGVRKGRGFLRTPALTSSSRSLSVCVSLAPLVYDNLTGCDLWPVRE